MNSHGLRQEEFFITHAVLCKPGTGQEIAASLKKSGHVEIPDWGPTRYVDGPYLYEVNYRATWPKEKWGIVTPRFLKNKYFNVAFPVEEYTWEYHLDASLPEGLNANMLAGWLMDSENLILDPTSHQLIRNLDGEIVAWSTRKKLHYEGILVRKEWFETFMKTQALECVWVTVGERGAWADNEVSGSTSYRRFNRITIFSDGKYSDVRWNEDHPHKNKKITPSALAEKR